MEIIMKKVKIIALIAAVAVTGTVIPILATSSEGNYDSANDPLVSLSYINEVLVPSYDKKIAELTEKIDSLSEENTKLKETVEKMVADSEGDTEDDTEDAENTASSQFEVVYLNKGAKLMAKTPCEIILRTGSAIAVSITVNGLNDITEGTEIYNAEDIPLYHSLLVPRGDDGRGIQITSPDAYIMVRGEYEIVQ